MTVAEFYAAVGGDYATALSRMMNDMLIRRFLGKLVAYDIAPLKEAANTKELFEAAHGLKGVAGNLSLDALFAKASALTEATRGNESSDVGPYLELKEEVLHEFEKEVSLIREHLS